MKRIRRIAHDTIGFCRTILGLSRDTCATKRVCTLGKEKVACYGEGPITFYIRVPVDPDGIALLSGKLEIVEDRANATKVVYGDAIFLYGKARGARPDLAWQIEKVDGTRYIVKADG